MAIILCAPTLVLIAAVIAAGTLYNEQQPLQRAILTQQRLLLRERALFG